MKTTFIYALLDPRTGKCRYIGKANNPRKRLRAHCNRAVPGATHKECWLSGLLAVALRPILEILDEVPVEKWEFFERAYIKVNRESGVDLTNIAEGGDAPMLGRTHSEEARQKMRGRAGPLNPNYGKTHSAETRELLAARARGNKHCVGRVVSEATKLKISQSLSGEKNPQFGKTGPDAPAFGRRDSPEDLVLRSSSMQGAKKSSGTSGFVGVSRPKGRGYWAARIQVRRKNLYLGSYILEEDAARAYDIAAKKHFGNSARLNFTE